MTHFPPPPPVPPRVGLFRRVPPAIFPALFGLLGLGVAWEKAAAVFHLDRALIDAGLGAVTLLFAFCVLCYAAKALLRPGAVAEDLKTLPGRTGLAALALGLCLEAEILAVYAPTLAKALLAVGVLGLLAIALPVLKNRIAGTDPTGPATPAMHLVFVGFVVAVIPAVALQVALPVLPWVVWYATAAGLVIYAVTMGGVLRGTAPPPLRPLQAIQLAPPALVATGAALTGQPTLALVSTIVAIAVALLLLLRLRWMTVAGFSGFWSAFTFPVVGFAGALLAVSDLLGQPALRIAGGVVLIAATLYIPVIAWKVLNLWAKGALAAKTNASIA